MRKGLNTAAQYAFVAAVSGIGMVTLVELMKAAYWLSCWIHGVA